MKTNISKLAIICAGAFALSSCSSSSKDKPADTTITKTETTVTVPAKEENAPDGTEYTVAPDSAILGKSKEALVKVTSASSIDLKDADGKPTGAELTVNLQVTNKSTLEAKKYFAISSSDARLELDNGTSITGTERSGSTNPEAEASSQAVWSFQLPPNASPKKLNFFLDGTRVSVGLTKK
ncbi:hypothetical protein OQX63_18895 [Pedobacter sp. PF22-3]|uniref:hypothetical protein n=1 Tax=Pedobacter sp. PF22-3 TaxID=2994467 RepID=UPI0022469E5B|nr:hypothetical protein [Pedobacter sp. PF22-3]MCX2495567.1 hypothetical protein [Pedobacter sp. PF22-3]